MTFLNSCRRLIGPYPFHMIACLLNEAERQPDFYCSNTMVKDDFDGFAERWLKDESYVARRNP